VNLSWHVWKDEHVQGRRLGLTDDTTHRHVEEGRHQVMALLEDRQGPFAEDWTGWSTRYLGTSLPTDWNPDEVDLAGVGVLREGFELAGTAPDRAERDRR
jgi:hypothetical protein